MNKELIKLAVMGLVLGSTITSCAGNAEKSSQMDSDQASCAGKSGCGGSKSSCSGNGNSKKDNGNDRPSCCAPGQCGGS